ncbi:MAG: sensor domain-containing diguanylate cyclase [Tardiphaga sp.]
MEHSTSPAEEARLAVLHSYSILDTGPEPAFDLITQLAQMALHLPIVLITLIDRDRQWIKSKRGMDTSETARSISFCTHAITQDRPFIVSDASIHPLFRDNPLVVGEPHIRFYIGIPLKMSDGSKIGTLCAIDTVPRALSTVAIDILSGLGSMVVDQIELRRLAVTDPLTGTLTRRGFDAAIDREMHLEKRADRPFSFIAVDVDHFKSVNDRFGHASGDIVLQAVVGEIRQELRPSDFVARLGGEEFVIALPDTDLDGARALAERIREKIAGTVIHRQSQQIRVTASFGIVIHAGATEQWASTLERADAALYLAKQRGRNICVCAPASTPLDTAAA